MLQRERQRRQGLAAACRHVEREHAFRHLRPAPHLRQNVVAQLVKRRCARRLRHGGRLCGHIGVEGGDQIASDLRQPRPLPVDCPPPLRPGAISLGAQAIRIHETGEQHAPEESGLKYRPLFVRLRIRTETFRSQLARLSRERVPPARKQRRQIVAGQTPLQTTILKPVIRQAGVMTGYGVRRDAGEHLVLRRGREVNDLARARGGMIGPLCALAPNVLLEFPRVFSKIMQLPGQHCQAAGAKLASKRASHIANRMRMNLTRLPIRHIRI